MKWATIDQCAVGLRHPDPKIDLPVRKSTWVCSNRPGVNNLSIACKCKGPHGTLEGTYKGKSVTSYSENYTAAFARRICHVMGIHPLMDALCYAARSSKFEAAVDADLESIDDPLLLNIFNSLEIGIYTKKQLNPIEVNDLEMWSGLELEEVQVTSNAQPPQAPRFSGSSRRATYVAPFGKGDVWLEAEGTVPVKMARLDSAVRAVTVFGESLLRTRPKSQPKLERQADMNAWLRRFHHSQGHMSGVEMAQALRDAGADPRLIRLASQFRCGICDKDAHPFSRRVCR